MSDSLKEEVIIMRHFQSVGFGLVIIFGSAISYLWAQNAAPQVYSYTEDPAISIMGPTIVKIVRDGPREAVNQIMPVGPGRDKEFHNHILYDFQAHKIYTKLVSDPAVPCTVMDYTSPAAPRGFDMISSAADAMKDMEQQHIKQIGTETINGIATKVMEATIEQGQEKVWVAQNGGFPVKVVITGPDGKAMTIIEVKQLSFAKPPASALLPPAGCKTIQGEASATGVHAEFGAGASSGGPPDPPWLRDVHAAPVVGVPYQAVISAGQVVRVKVPAGQSVHVDWKAGADGTEVTVVPFKDGKPVDDFMLRTARISSAVTMGDTFGPWPDGAREIVVRVNKESATVSAKAVGQAAAPAGGPGQPPGQATAGGAPQARVTAVHLKVVPAEYSGVCPVKVQLEGTLTADGPGKAYFQFQAGAVGANREGTVEVSAAGTATVSSEGEVRRTPRVPSVRFLAGMEPRGHQENAKWTDVHLNISCTNAP
jgi:hypothetical protein